MESKQVNYFNENVIWQKNGEAKYPYKASLNGQTLKLRINNFPEENLYTLLENEKEITDFDDFPINWKKPK